MGEKRSGKKKKGEPTYDALIHEATSAVRKKYKGAIIGSGSEELVFPDVWLSMGSLALDRVCRGRNPGGIPIGPKQGRMIHIAGDWSTGKSLILDHLFKSVQDIGGIALCSETEGSRDPYFAQLIGLDLDKLVIKRPPTIEEVIDWGIAFHNSIRQTNPTIPILWGIDSLDSVESTKMKGIGLSESGGWRYGGGRSEALGAGLKKVSSLCANFPTTLVMLNQTRENIGVMFGPKKRTPGGNPPHFYASLELMLSVGRKGDVRGKYEGTKLTGEQRKRLGMRATERGDVVGRWIRARVSKSKVGATANQEADFYIAFHRGVHKWAGLLQRLLHEGKVTLGEKEVIKYSGHTFPNEKAWLIWLSENQHLLEEGK